MSVEYKFWGGCHQVALVLHRLTGKTIVALYGERNPDEMEKPYDYELTEEDEEELEEFVPCDDEEVEKILIHCGVLINGKLVDEIGFNGSPEDELEYYLLHGRKTPSFRSGMERPSSLITGL